MKRDNKPTYFYFSLLPLSFYLFTFLSFTFFISPAQPSWQWALNGNCTTADNGSSVATDINGNVFTTGHFYGSNLTFSSTTLVNAGNYDAFISKHDNNGNLLWARAIGDAFDDVGNAVTCDNSGNVFVCGYYSSSTMAIGSFTLTNLGGTDVFIAKYDANGNVLWAKSFGDNMIEEANGITCDGNNIYMTGQFQSNAISFGTGTLTCNGGGDVFVLKYDNNGNEIWGKSFGDTGLDIGYSISTMAGNDIFVTGSFRSPTLTFSTYTLNNNGGSDYFIARYNSSGNEIWAKGEGGNTDDAGTSVLINLNGIYTAGYFKSSTISFGAASFTNAAFTSADAFVVNYNFSGNELWAKAYGGNLDDIPYGLASDYAGAIFFGGHIHSSSVTMGSYTLNCNGIGDLFIAKINLAGSLTWAENIGGFQDEGLSGLASDLNGKIFATGFFNSGSVNFNSITLNNTGSADLFVAKLNNIPTGLTENSNTHLQTLIYPNPASSGFTIKNIWPETTIKVFDLAGLEVMFLKLQKQESVYIDIQKLPEGIYFVSLISGNYHQIIKLVVVH